MNEKVIKRENINDVVSDFIKKNLAINVNVPFEERIENLRTRAVGVVNRSITRSDFDEIKTTANYAPYFSQVLVEGIHRCKVIDVVRAKRSDNLITSLVSNVHETGEMNPTLIVRGYGHAVKGLDIGDCIDINPEPGCLVRRSVIDFDDDFEAIHDYYYKRNPNMVKAVNFDKGSKVLIEGAPAVDLDKPDDVVTICFAYVIEARFITGIYYNKKTVDRAIEAFKMEPYNKIKNPSDYLSAPSDPLVDRGGKPQDYMAPGYTRPKFK